MTEADILHEAGDFWVSREYDRYTVWRNGITHAVSDSSYRKDANGLLIAIRRCDYLWRRLSGVLPHDARASDGAPGKPILAQDVDQFVIKDHIIRRPRTGAARALV